MPIRTKVTVTERVFCKQQYEGAIVLLENGKVTDVALTWLVKTSGSSGWQEFRLPDGVDQLRRLRQAIDGVLAQLLQSQERLDWEAVTGVEEREG